jgi:hypothetical protein
LIWIAAIEAIANKQEANFKKKKDAADSKATEARPFSRGRMPDARW